MKNSKKEYILQKQLLKHDPHSAADINFKENTRNLQIAILEKIQDYYELKLDERETENESTEEELTDRITPLRILH